MGESVNVSISQIAAVTGDAFIVMRALGSCVGLILRDPKAMVSGCAHILLPENPGRAGPRAAMPGIAGPVSVYSELGKYAGDALYYTTGIMYSLGASRARLSAYMTGGAAMFPMGGNASFRNIGEMNIAAVRAALEESGIPVVFSCVGGVKARSLRYGALSGEIRVTGSGGESAGFIPAS